MLPCLPKTCLVVPCYNEADRLEPAAFVEFATRNPTVSFCFVDDGSRDATGAVLDDLVAVLGEQGRIVSYTKNSGKAHAVRTGILQTLASGQFDYIGYWDADLATPLDELLTLFDRAGAARQRDLCVALATNGCQHPASLETSPGGPRVCDDGIADGWSTLLRHPVRGQNCFGRRWPPLSLPNRSLANGYSTSKC